MSTFKVQTPARAAAAQLIGANVQDIRGAQDAANGVRSTASTCLGRVSRWLQWTDAEGLLASGADAPD